MSLRESLERQRQRIASLEALLNDERQALFEGRVDGGVHPLLELLRFLSLSFHRLRMWCCTVGYFYGAVAHLLQFSCLSIYRVASVHPWIVRHLHRARTCLRCLDINLPLFCQYCVAFKSGTRLRTRQSRSARTSLSQHNALWSSLLACTVRTGRSILPCLGT